MRYEEFVGRVGELIGGEGSEEAELAAASTLATLGERIDGEEACALASRLPDGIRQHLVALPQGEEAGSFSLEEFYERVCVREDVSLGEAKSHAGAVMSVVGEAVNDGKLEDVMRQLPEEFRPLFDPAAASMDGMGYRGFVGRVEERMEEGGEDGCRGKNRASLALTSTLVTLGECITGGEAEDLAAHLPAGLREKLSGSHQEEVAEDFSLAEFYRRVSTREGVSPEEAYTHVRMVMRTLGESAGKDELEGIKAQLPREFEPLFG